MNKAHIISTFMIGAAFGGAITNLAFGLFEDLTLSKITIALALIFLSINLIMVDKMRK